MEFPWKALQKILVLILIRTYVIFECFGIAMSDLTYKELKDLNATCKGLDSCEVPRRHKVFEHCHCGVGCNLLGTCCVDSKYRNRQEVPMRNVFCENYNFQRKRLSLPILNNCDFGMLYDDTTEEFCTGDADDLKDPFLKIPVTDSVTGISYKNYYCAACNRNNGKEHLIPWDLRLKTEEVSFELKDTLKPDLHRSDDSWYITLEQGLQLDVNLHFNIPEKLISNLPYCYDFYIIAECGDNWTDVEVEEKCASYMALTRILSPDGTFYNSYRNPHCAICNYENMTDKICLVPVEDGVDELLFQNTIYTIELSSLRNETLKCGNNMIYDFFKKYCRKLKRTQFRNKMGKR